MNIIIKKPIISEKSMKLAKEGLYTFLVDKFARKPAIKKAVEAQFDVKVESVKTVNIKGRSKMQKSRKGWYATGKAKKAYVVLKKGHKIGLFEAKAEVATGEEETGQVKEKKSLLKGTKVKIEKKGEKSV